LALGTIQKYSRDGKIARKKITIIPFTFLTNSNFVFKGTRNWKLGIGERGDKIKIPPQPLIPD
jgi:hypothetical protein